MNKQVRICWYVFAFHLRRRHTEFLNVLPDNQLLIGDGQDAIRLAVLRAGKEFPEGFRFVAVPCYEGDTNSSFRERTENAFRVMGIPEEQAGRVYEEFHRMILEIFEEQEWEEGVEGGRISPWIQ